MAGSVDSSGVDAPGARALVLEALERFLKDADPGEMDPPAFLEAQFDAGLAWVHFDRGFGGLGVPVGHQGAVRSALDELKAPNTMRISPVAYGQAGGAIHDFGTDEQRSRWLRPMFSCREMWCQLFSEPGSGSDLAGLSTMAMRDGEEWVINGQKVWSSAARHADWAILLARTDPTAPKHQGLTLFGLNMGTPGVEVRPIREMTGNAHFNEVFLDDVRIPDAHRIGDVNRGWSVSTSALRYERALAADYLHEDDFMLPVLAQWNDRREQMAPSIRAVKADRVVATWIRAQVVSRLLDRSRASDLDGSIPKLAVSRLRQEVAALQMALLGAAGTVGVDYDLDGATFAHGDRSVQELFLNSPSATIAAGTSEIMRSIIGERLLGLPGEPRSDKSIPWSDLPRN